MPFWSLFYHFVWTTFNRDPIIADSWQSSLYNVICAKASEMGAIVYGVGGMPDHIHLAVAVPPKISLSVFIGQIKGNSSHFVNHELSIGRHFGWQEEYGVVSFGHRNLATVVQYVKNQKAHHDGGTEMRFLERDTAEP